MHFDAIEGGSIEAVLLGIAQRARQRRLEKNMTQQVFAKRAGVGYAAYRKFENTGEVTLRNLILCAFVFDDTEIFSQLFSKKVYQNLDEILEQKKAKKRKRASAT